MLRFEHAAARFQNVRTCGCVDAGAQAGADLADPGRRGERLRAAHQGEQTGSRTRREPSHRPGEGRRRDRSRPRASASRRARGRPGARVRPDALPAPPGTAGTATASDTCLPREQAREVVEQREATRARGRRRAPACSDVRLGDRTAAPRSRIARSTMRRRRQADQLERADALVDLLARGAQHAGVDRVDVGAVTASASFRKRRSDLCAASSDARSSSWTQAIALRSSSAPWSAGLPDPSGCCPSGVSANVRKGRCGDRARR